jgi:hypothetical protein
LRTELHNRDATDHADNHERLHGAGRDGLASLSAQAIPALREDRALRGRSGDLNEGKINLALARREAVRNAVSAATSAARARGDQATPFDLVLAVGPAVDLAHRLMLHDPHNFELNELALQALEGDPATDAEATALLESAKPVLQKLEAAEREVTDRVICEVLVLAGFDPSDDEVVAETERAKPLLEDDLEDAAGVDWAFRIREVDPSQAEILNDPHAVEAYERIYHHPGYSTRPDVRQPAGLRPHGRHGRHRRAPGRAPVRRRGSRRCGAGSRAGPDDPDDPSPPAPAPGARWQKRPGGETYKAVAAPRCPIDTRAAT